MNDYSAKLQHAAVWLLSPLWLPLALMIIAAIWVHDFVCTPTEPGK